MSSNESDGSSIQSTPSKGTSTSFSRSIHRRPVFDRTIPKGFKLSIFALEDGKNHVAQITKQMAVAVTEGDRFTSDSINVQLVDKWMSGIYPSVSKCSHCQ
jgi:undecaprenyl pyrophosphate synthase